MCRRLILIPAFALALLACPPQQFLPSCEDPKFPCPADPAYPETELDGVGSEAGNTCRQLRALRCSEGFADERTKRTCFQRLTRDAELVDVPHQCVRAAHNAEQVRACGNETTLRFRCFAPKGH